MIERDDGTLCLPTRGDPAHERVEGYRRYWLGCDLGQNDPTGLVLIRDQRVPFWEGSRQVLGMRQRAVVWADYVRDTSYSAICDYLRHVMSRPFVRGKVKLAIDATGLGRPFSDFLIEKQIDHAAVTITAGTATSQKDHHYHVAKTILLGDLANALETRYLQIAHDLPLRDRLMQELESFEIKTTAAGNQILNARATEHHADLAIAAAIALYASSQAYIGSHVGQLAGYWF